MLSIRTNTAAVLWHLHLPSTLLSPRSGIDSNWLLVCTQRVSLSLKGYVSHIQRMILPGERLQVFAHHFMMGTGVFKGLIKLGDLSQVSQQVRDKGRNTIKTFLGPRPNASGHDVKIRICQLSFTAHFPGISRDAPSLPSPQVCIDCSEMGN